MPVIDRRIPLFLALAATLAMLVLTGWQGYQFWQTETRHTLPQSTSPATGSSTRGATVPKVELASLELFGTTSATGEAQITDTENLPETNLRLLLRGVLASDGDFPGSALIEDDKSKTEAYLVGDELPGNATLRTVFANRVVIDRSGKLENLFFPESDDRSGVSLSSNSQPDPRVQQPTTSPAAADNSASQQQRREEIRQRLEQLRQRLQNNN